uniref:Telomerase reverse transcriptase n=1 Tax=Timspurckia oligopyrenoides TaxID=708627 RepID=A0A7S0ZAF1_9RHOD|mmetsp:Transcript_10126/g.18234  ORF Transcript_10126/g.18234 Transcript_10126/m.18234 type:complete len:388 (+) Transcript_10126:1-1164(+)
MLFETSNSRLLSRLPNVALISSNERQESITKRDVVSSLHGLIDNRQVQIRNQICTQACGIPQGHVLSPTLAALYLSHLESTYFSDLLEPSFADGGSDEKKPVFAIRYHDDYLFAHSDSNVVTEFTRRMHSGFESYNMQANQSKTKIVTSQVDYSNSGMVSHGLRSGTIAKRVTNGSLLSWCGLLVDTNSMSLRRDYSRYADVLLRDTFTVKAWESFGMQLKARSQNGFRDRLPHALLLDAQIQTRKAVLVNVLEASALNALKFLSFRNEVQRIRTSHGYSDKRYSSSEYKAFWNRCVFESMRAFCARLEATRNTTTAHKLGFRASMTQDELRFVVAYGYRAALRFHRVSVHRAIASYLYTSRFKSVLKDDRKYLSTIPLRNVLSIRL